MATINISKRASGGYTVTHNGKTEYFGTLLYRGTDGEGVGLFTRDSYIDGIRNVLPADWTIDGVSTYTTELEVVNALDGIGVGIA